MKKIIYILIYFVGVTLMANPVLESENLISEMSEIGLSISKPSDNLPMMLDVIPLSKQRSIYINVNSFKQGFTPILHIKYRMVNIA